VIVTTVTVRVPAKINLQLAVGPPRADGYHGLVTVFHAVSLFDEVTVEAAEADSVAVAGEGADLVPADGDNLALRAVRALRGAIGRTGGSDGVAVKIRKRIPVAGGLAGGSADAAAALVACNDLWRAGLSVRELCDVAGGVGSDVAFAVLGGTAVGRGRGEQLTSALVAPVPYHWVLAFADGQLSTPAVYGRLDRMRSGRDVDEPKLSAELMSALRAGAPDCSARRSATTCRPRGGDVPRAAQDPRGRHRVRRARRARLRVGTDVPFPGRQRRSGDRPRGRALKRGRLPVGGDGHGRGTRRIRDRPLESQQ